MGRYAEAFRRSLADPEGFWGEAARAIDWDGPPTVLDALGRAALPLVHRRRAQHLLQRARPARATPAAATSPR